MRQSGSWSDIANDEIGKLIKEFLSTTNLGEMLESGRSLKSSSRYEDLQQFLNDADYSGALDKLEHIVGSLKSL